MELTNNYTKSHTLLTLVNIKGAETVYYQVRALAGTQELDNMVFPVIVRL